MQVRQAIAASLLAFTAIAAMSQEIDPSENLQGKSLAAQREKAAQALARAREASGVEVRTDEAARQAKVGEGAAAPAAKAVPDTQHAQEKSRSKVGFDLTRYHPKHKSVVGEQG
jgi:hypothetical protein